MVYTNLDNEFTYPIYFYVFAELIDKQLRIGEQILRVIKDARQSESSARYYLRRVKTSKE